MIAPSARGDSEQLLGSAPDRPITDVPTAAPHDRAGDARAALVGQAFASIDNVAVVDGETFVGMVPLRRLLAAGDATPVSELMDAEAPTVAPGCDQEDAIRAMLEHRESSVAVVDANDRFRGLVGPRQLLELLLAKHDQDLARIAGFTTGTLGARRAAEEPVGLRVRHRLPWLLVGLVGAMASAVIVGSFENQLDAKVLLAFFLPAVVYMADAVGTQTEALLIRGLSVGVTIRSVAARELLTGLGLGVIVGACFFPFVLAGWGDPEVALAVALALVGSCSFATGVAMLLPWLFASLGRDPAFGAGPVATVIQDLLSIATYLAIAVPIAS